MNNSLLVVAIFVAVVVWPILFHFYKREQRPTVFDAAGKDKLHFIVDQISRFDEDGYSISTYGDGIDGGYSITLWGKASQFWLNGEKQKFEEIRLGVKINSDNTRHEFERGIIGGGRVDSEQYRDIELNVAPEFVRDIVYEMRRNPERGMRIDGVAISPKIFRVVHFVLWERSDLTR